MNTNKIKVVLPAVLVAALIGCTPSPQDVSLSEGQKRAMKENKAQAVVAMTEDGKLITLDKDGGTSSLLRCSVGPEGKGELKQCPGLMKGATLQSIRSLTLIKSKYNPECWTIVDPTWGYAEEICW